MAPQVLQGVYTSQADLWSVGVVTFMLLSSEQPFQGIKRREVVDKVMRGDYTLDSDVWNVISDEAKDMVKGLLEVDPEVRLNAASALLHKWLLKEFDLSDGKPSEEVEGKVKKSLMMYQNSSKLKKIALNVSSLT
jgi:serine/threonine protein kinase